MEQLILVQNTCTLVIRYSRVGNLDILCKVCLLIRLILLLANFLLNRLEKSLRTSANLADDETFKQHQLYDKSKMHWLGETAKVTTEKNVSSNFCKTFHQGQK